MKCNVGKTDRTVRSVLGLTVCIAGIILNKWLILIGGILLLRRLLGGVLYIYLLGYQRKIKNNLLINY